MSNKCNKISYETSQEARKDIRRFTATGNKGRGDGKRRLKPYICPYCGYWHITSKKILKGKKRKMLTRQTKRV